MNPDRATYADLLANGVVTESPDRNATEHPSADQTSARIEEILDSGFSSDFSVHLIRRLLHAGSRTRST